MKNLNLRQLEAFRALMLGKTVTRAAELLFVSQPAVTRLISDLETAVGFTLFERRKKRLHPTPEAWALFDAVDRSFAGLAKIADTAREIREFRSGSLSIAALPALALTFLPQVIAEFGSDKLDVSLSLQIRSSQKVSELAAMQRIDVGFTEGTHFVSGVQSELLLTANLVCLLPPDHHLAAKSSLVAADLDGESFIAAGGWQATRTQIDQYFEQQGVKRKIQIDTQLFAAVGDFVLAGAGVSLIDPITAERYQQLGVTVRPFTPAIPFRFYVIYPENRPQSRLTRQFVALLQDRLAKYSAD